MLLVELWNRYISKTMPVIGPGGIPLMCLQMLGGIPSLIGMYRSVHRESAGERVLLCAAPGILITTAAVVEPMLFGAFLGDGFPWVDALRAFLFQPAFFRETMALAGLFLVAAAVSWILQRRGRNFSVLRFLLSTGVGLAAAAAFLLLGADYCLNGGTYFSTLNDGQIKWTVYGVYLLLYQLCVTLLCILWQLLFSEPDAREEEPNRERWLRRYLSRSSRACGWGILMYAVLWFFAVVKGLRDEGSPYGLVLAVNVILVMLGAWLLLRAVIQPDVKRILAWGDPDETLYQLHKEIALQKPLVKTPIGFLTEHYLVMNNPRRIFCRALLKGKPGRNAVGAYVLHFQDGGKCRVGREYQQLLSPLLGGQTQQRRPTQTRETPGAWEYDS